MYNPLLETIFTVYEENFSDEPDYTIDFYEANNSSFIETDEFDREYLSKYEVLSAKYIAALVIKKQYKQAIAQSKKILTIIDHNEAILNITHQANSPYNGIIYQRAIAKYRSYIFKSALRDFAYLLGNEPQNLYVKRWYIAASHEYYTYLCLGISFCSFLIVKTIKGYMPALFAVVILGVGLGSCLIAMIFTITKQIRLKNIPR